MALGLCGRSTRRSCSRARGASTLACARRHTPLACRSEDGSGDAEMVDEEGIDVNAVMGGGHSKKRKSADEASLEGGSPATADKPKVRSAARARMWARAFG
jgi:hypothetical protein